MMKWSFIGHLATSSKAKLAGFLTRLCSVHDKGLKKLEMLCLLPGILMSCWFLHPKSTGLVHQQFHGTEIILGVLFHSSSVPVGRVDICCVTRLKTNMYLAYNRMPTLYISNEMCRLVQECIKASLKERGTLSGVRNKGLLLSITRLPLSILTGSKSPRSQLCLAKIP